MHTIGIPGILITLAMGIFIFFAVRTWVKGRKRRKQHQDH